MGTSLQLVDRLVPGANLESYIQAASRIPVLTVDEERELAERLHYDGDVDAARHLVLSHLRFVIHIARSYSGYGLALACVWYRSRCTGSRPRFTSSSCATGAL